MSGKKGMRVPKASLDNLKERQGQFANNSELARECQKKSVAKRLENQEKQKEIETSAKILNRLLNKMIKNNKTGEEITQKEAMLLGVLYKAINEHDLKAVEMVLKLIGDLSDKISVDMTARNAEMSIEELKALKAEIEADE